MALKLCLLGGLSVSHGEQQRQIPLDRPVSLLVCLAVRGDWVGRSELALMYRPDSDERQGLAYVRTIIHRARQLDWAGDLEVQGDRVRLLVGSDVAEFRAAVAERRWAAALDLYAGRFLLGAKLPRVPGFDSWVDVEAEALQASWYRAGRKCAAELSLQGENGQAAAIYRRLLDADPLDEDVLQAYVRALSADGRSTEAKRAFEAFERTLEHEVGGQPLESTMLLIDSLQPPESPVGTAKGQLPHPTTSFVGRTRELALLKKLLRNPANRLIVVQGMGGTGKSRLATEAARAHTAETGIRTVFVSLAELSLPERLPLAIAEAHGFRATGDDASEVLEVALRNQELLLLLDNFEEILPAAPYLTRLLEVVPQLTILVTSRESLKLTGETTVELAGLDLDTDDASRYDDAAALFIERAARHSPDFTASGRTLDAVVDICRQVECLPLAIEIVATWARLLPVTELSGQLSTRSDLLTSNLLDLPERQRNIWSILSHVWKSLTSSQQAVMVRLSVFRGGFTLEAATAVAGANLDIVAGLLDRSLVRRTARDRFTIHELLRQHIANQVPAAELQAARQDHARWFSQQAELLDLELQGADLPTGMEKVEADRANFEAAWNYAIETVDLEFLEQCSGMLDNYLYYRARFRAGFDHFGRAAAALARVAAQPGPAQQPAGRLQGRLLAKQAQQQAHLDGAEAAIATASEAVSILEQWGSEVDKAHARQVLGTNLLFASRYQAARTELQFVLDTALAERDQYLEASARNGLAMLLTYADGDVMAAEEQYRESLRLYQTLGNLQGVSSALTNIGACRFDLDDLNEAEQLWTQAADMCAAVGFQHREAALLNNLGAVAESRGDFAAAATRYQRSLEIRRELHNRPGISLVLASLGRLGLQRNDPEDARKWLQEALELQLELADLSGVAHSRSQLARALLQLGRHSEAISQALQAVKLSAEIGSHPDTLGALLTGAMLLAELGETENASALAGAIAAHAADTQEPLRLAALDLRARLNSASLKPAPGGLDDLVDLTVDWLRPLNANSTARL